MKAMAPRTISPAVVEGVETVRRITARCDDIIAEELSPGAAVTTPDEHPPTSSRTTRGDTTHRAAAGSGRPAIRGAVVDSRFRVHGAQPARRRRVGVPAHPGVFHCSAVYMIGEKASDVIAEDAGVTRSPTGKRSS